MENNAWISTSEQEPEFGREVLLCMEESDGRRRIMIGERAKGIYPYYVRYILGEEVNLSKFDVITTHWMPLPELPR
jgi:hypothetical protein